MKTGRVVESDVSEMFQLEIHAVQILELLSKGARLFKRVNLMCFYKTRLMYAFLIINSKFGRIVFVFATVMYMCKHDNLYNYECLFVSSLSGPLFIDAIIRW